MSDATGDASSGLTGDAAPGPADLASPDANRPSVDSALDAASVDANRLPTNDSGRDAAPAIVDASQPPATDSGPQDGPADSPRDGALDTGRDTGRDVDANRAPDAATEETAPSCNSPPALLVPTSDTDSQPYDVAMAASPTSGIGVLWSRWPSGYDPPWNSFQPATRAFGTTATIVSDQKRSAEHVAVTALPDGRFATAWASDGGLGPEFVYVSIGPETSSPVTLALAYGEVRYKVPSVSIAPFGSTRVAVSWIDCASGTDNPVVIVEIDDLTLARVQQLSITPLGTDSLSAQLVANGDQLFVLMSQLTGGVEAELSMAKVAISTLAVTPPKHIFTGTPSNIVFTTDSMAYTYPTDTNLMLATLDFDGNPTGAPKAVMPATGAGVVQLFRIGSAYHLMRFVSDANYGTLHYTKLDANLQPVSDITLGNKDVPRPVDLFQTPSGLIAGWYSMKGVYLSPLCP